MSSVIQNQGTSSSRWNSASLAPVAASSQPLPRTLNSAAPEDDYDYHDTGPPVPPTNPKQRSGAPSIIDGTDNPDRSALDEVWMNVFEKEFRSSRAQVPDDYGLANGTLSVPQDQSTTPATTSSPSRTRKRRFFKTPRLPIDGTPPRSAEKTVLRKVELHWSRREDNGTKKILLNACIVHNDSSIGSDNSVLWQ